MNLAVTLGANPIYLLGFDMALGPDGKAHYHSGYSMPFPVRKLAAYIDNFNYVAPILKERGVEVVNLSPVSALKCFPKYSPDEVLA
jgi:hypothetical protein